MNGIRWLLFGRDARPYGRLRIIPLQHPTGHREWGARVNRIHGFSIGFVLYLGRYGLSVCRPISGSKRRKLQADALSDVEVTT